METITFKFVYSQTLDHNMLWAVCVLFREKKRINCSIIQCLISSFKMNIVDTFKPRFKQQSVILN